MCGPPSTPPVVGTRSAAERCTRQRSGRFLLDDMGVHVERRCCVAMSETPPVSGGFAHRPGMLWLPPETERDPPKKGLVPRLLGSPYGIRTRAATLRGRLGPSDSCCGGWLATISTLWPLKVTVSVTTVRPRRGCNALLSAESYDIHGHLRVRRIRKLAGSTPVSVLLSWDDACLAVR